MKLKLLILIVIIGGAFSPLSAQVGIGITTPDSSAMLQVFSTTRGFLPPYMTQAQRDSISTPAEGLMLYCSDCSPEGYYVYIDGAWESLHNTTLSEADVDGFVANNGYLSSEVDGSTTNEIQTISRSGLTLTLSNNGGTVQDSVLDETAVDNYVANNGYLTQDTTLTEAEVDAFVANNGYLTSFTEVDGSVTNEIQDLSIANDTLTLSGDATTVDLKPYLDNTDNQAISRSGLTVTLENGGTFQDSVLDETAVDNYVANNGYLSSEVDGSVTNEIQDLSIANDTLTLSGDATTVDLKPYLDNTDNQAISRSGLTVTLENGGTFQDSVLDETAVDNYVANNGYLTSEVDGSTTNEIQTISRSGLTLTLSNNGGTVQDSVLDEAAVDSYVANNGYLTQDTTLTEAEVDAFVANNGYLTSFTEVDGSVTNEIQDLSLANDTLTLTGDGTTVDLTAYRDNTDDQIIDSLFVDPDNRLNISLEGDNRPAQVVDLGAFRDNTDNQAISRSGLTVTLENGGTFQDSVLDETAVDNYVANNGYLTQDTTLTEAEVDAFVANNGYLTSFAEVDGSVTNEIQDLSIANDTLTLSGDATTVDLKPYLDNTDNQAISRSGLTVTLENGGTFQDSVLDETTVDNYVANNGYLTSFTEVDGSTTNEIQDLSLSNNTLSLTGDGTSVDLGGYLDNTDDQTISRSGLTVTLEDGGSFQDSVLDETAVDNYVANNGYITSEVDGSTTNEIQTISRSGLTLTLSNGGGTVQDSVLDETAVDNYVANNGYLTQDTTLTEAEVDAFVANNGYLTSFTEVDGSVTNEIQDLSLSNNTLSLTGDGTTVDLGGYLDNTDNQAISRSGLTVTLENGGTFQDSVLDETAVDNYVANNGYLTSFTEVDGSTSNELQTISKVGSTVTLSNSGGSFTDDVLTEAEVDAYANNNGYLTSFTEVDGSTTNEIQDLSLSNNTLSLSGDATTVDLGGYLDNTDAQDLSLTGNTLSLTNDASSVDLSQYLDNTNLTESQVDAYVGNNGYLTSFTEVDGSTSNELQTISKVGSTVTLSNSGGSFTDDVLSEAQVDNYVSNNGYLTSFTEVDGSTTNEIQDLSLSGSTLSLSGDATTVDLSGLTGSDDLGNHTATQNLNLGTNKLVGNGGSTGISIQSNGKVELNSGTGINEFSTDGTLSGDSDDAVPTEQAVKTYVDGQVGNVNTMYDSDGDIGGNRQITIGSGRWFRFRSFDLTSSNFLSESRLTLQNGTATLSAFTGNGAGAITATNQLYIDQTRSLINGDFRTQTGSGDGITTFDVLPSGVMSISRNHGNLPSITTSMSSGNPQMTFNNNGTDRIVLNATGTSFFSSLLQTNGGIEMVNSVSEFSTDGTLAGNSDAAVPTEKAIKTYVDNAVSSASSGGSPGLQLSATGTSNYYNHASNYGTINSGAERNLALGYNALNNVTGDDNVALGYLALETSGTSSVIRNIAIGNYALNNIGSNCYYNIAIGTDALKVANGADRNIAIGDESGEAITSGDENVMIGKNSAKVLTTGTANTLIGTEAARDMTSGDNNVMIGSDAGASVIAESNNTWLGTGAGSQSSTSMGVFIGRGAGWNESNDNMLIIEADAIGLNNPLISGTFSGDRVGINVTSSTVASGGATLQVGGDLSLLNGTTVNELSTDGTLAGNSDDAVPTEKAVKNYVDNNAGKLVLSSAGSNNYHTNISNMTSIAGGSYSNTAVGYQSQLNLTTGDYNVSLGGASAALNSTGSYNTAIGYQALYYNTSGISNVAIGTEAGMDITGHYNVAIGQEAAQNTTGNYNTIIGRRAGYNAQTNGSIYLGYNAGYSEDNDNRLYIENSSTTQPLIGGSFSHNVVTINTDIGGSGFDFAAHASNKAYNLFINGGAYKSTGGTGWNHSSDRRLKTDIQYLKSDDILDKVLQMKGVSYVWNDTVTGLMRDDGIQYGFIAQDLQKVWPEKIIDDPYGYLATSYGTYDAMFVEAIRALNQKIINLETENEALKAQAETQKDQQAEIEALRAEMDELKDLIKSQISPVSASSK